MENNEGVYQNIPKIFNYLLGIYNRSALTKPLLFNVFFFCYFPIIECITPKHIYIETKFWFLINYGKPILIYLMNQTSNLMLEFNKNNKNWLNETNYFRLFSIYILCQQLICLRSVVTFIRRGWMLGRRVKTVQTKINRR